MTDQPQGLEEGRRTARRRWAGISFYALTAEGVAVLSVLLLAPERADVAAALATASSVLVGFFAAQTTVIGAYLGVSLADSWRRQQK